MKVTIFILFLLIASSSIKAQEIYTEQQVEKIINILAYSLDPEYEKNPSEANYRQNPPKKGANMYYRNIAIWNACKQNEGRFRVLVDTIYVRPIEGQHLYNLIVRGKSYPISKNGKESVKELEKQKKNVEFLLNIQYVFHIKWEPSPGYWHYLADDIGIKITKCTKPWVNVPPPPPEIKMPDIVVVPDEDSIK